MEQRCKLCPRGCDVSRPNGVCSMPREAVVARIGRHIWEEPCISGERGSGTVFFSGCVLGCVYCQNRAISMRGAASDRFRTYDAPALRRACLALAESGVHNINFVTPTHYADTVLEAAREGFGVPVVYNCGGYEALPALGALHGTVQIYLPDLKYADPVLAARYSSARDYPTVAKDAICEMVRQRGNWRMDENGILQSGVLVRHLVLPGQTENSLQVIEWLNDTFSEDEILISVMGQFTPTANLKDGYPELCRCVTEAEYAQVCDAVENGHLLGYLQELSSADQAYIPNWGTFEV